MSDLITEELFRAVESTVRMVGSKALEDEKLVLTEVDLQAWIFAEIVNNPYIESIANGDVHVHTEFNYLKYNRRLGMIPDIVLVPRDHYSVSRDGELHYRKGYTFWGSSIALELKILRSFRRGSFVASVATDIQKLSRIRQLHYDGDRNHRFFGATVILCRHNLSNEDEQSLFTNGRQNDIQVWILKHNNGEQGAADYRRQGPPQPER